MSTLSGINDLNKELEMEGVLSTPEPALQEGGNDEMESEHFADKHPKYPSDAE